MVMTKLKLLGKYKNGNYTVTMLNDGTKIRETEEGYFRPEFPECIDVCISRKCNAGCSFCYEGCSPEGKEAIFFDHEGKVLQPWIETLKPYTEVALNVNSVLNDQLIELLFYLRNKKVIANITVHQKEFMLHYDIIKLMSEKNFVKGIGISLHDPSDDEFFKAADKIPNVVIHTIAGLLDEHAIERLMHYQCKVLILGYKIVGKGIDYYDRNRIGIEAKQKQLKELLPGMIRRCKVVSFDNLAIDQLNVKDALFKDRSDWDEFYMGDDGEFTFYIDAVNQTYSKNSLVSKSVQYPLLESVVDMFKTFKNESI